MQGTRNVALDHTKGVLVLVMVAYHVMSIATTATREDFAWLRFVSGAFIVLTGWVVALSANGSAVSRANGSAVSSANGGAGSSAHSHTQANHSLTRRGTKVLLLFLALNAAILATGWGNPHKAVGQAMPLMERVWVVMTQAPSHLASFLILLPIGCLLLTAPLALRLNTLHPWASPLSMVVAIALACVPAATEASAVLSFWLLGWMGLTVGLLWQRMAALLQRWQAPRFVAPVAGQPLVTTLGAGAALALMLALSARWQSSVACQALGIGGVLCAMVALVRVWPAPAWAASMLALLGRYSLLAYVAQIVLIHTLHRWMGAQRVALGGQALWLMVVTAVGAWGVCWLTERMRSRSVVADRSYRLIFA